VGGNDAFCRAITFRRCVCECRCALDLRHSSVIQADCSGDKPENESLPRRNDENPTVRSAHRFDSRSFLCRINDISRRVN